jgi:DNA topoisomerase I
MAEKLVIVESPTKAKTIGRMLGEGYRILASVGHIRDLPQNSFGVDINNNFTPLYQDNPASGKIIKELRSAAKKASDIYLAPDPDREGEAIAWHLQELLKKGFKGEFHRVTFHEITKSAINQAFDHAGEVDMDRVNAQQARRVLDRLVGYQVSPLLWSHIERGISAGRVQSVALRLVVDREREILAFVPKEFWNFTATLEVEDNNDKLLFETKLALINDKKFEIDNGEDAANALAAVKAGNGFRIAKIETTPKKRNAPPPFITSSLQQTANSRMRWSASQTMRIAQSLYEGMDVGTGGSVGLITYMRTDSFNIANEARDLCRNLIGSKFGPDYLPAKPNFFKSKSSAQEAHEAIRPTNVALTPEQVKPYLDDQQYRLYSMIWKRFVASQMAPAKLQQTTVDSEVMGFDNRKYTFRAGALVTVFPGFTTLYDTGQESKDDINAVVLGQLKEKQDCALIEAGSEQKFTEPPPRYTEATLIRALETNGIGRPSTYATIMRTIMMRNYVERITGKLHPTELGIRVVDFLVKSLPSLFEVKFTSKMEDELDKVEAGQTEWVEMLRTFYEDYSQWLTDAKNIGAPETNKVTSLLEQLDKIKFDEPVKVGRRTYDDNKFCTSIREKFAKDNTITAKQWDALLKIVIKYKEQLPELKAFAEQAGFAAELSEAKVKHKEAEEKRKGQEASEDEVNHYTDIFSRFDKVEWEKAPPKSRFNDEKFFKSLKRQALSGKKLSEKQINALGRMVDKYQSQIEGVEELNKMLDIPQGEEPGERIVDPEVQAIIEQMSKITEWQPPAKKGRRTYDDKEFYESISNQFARGKTLSPRQIGALKKLAGKYQSKDSS